MDRRQQKTRNAIFQAFGALLAEKNYSKMTVQNIIDKANIGRTTFYAHFQTKDDLLKEMCVDLFSHVFSETLNIEKTHDFSMKTGNPRAIITHILYHMLDSNKNIMGILTSESGELFLTFFRQYLNKLLAARILEGSDMSDKGIPEDFLINHISSSFVGMVQWWIKNSLKQSPELLSDYFLSVIAPAV
ncbi:TetR/AcrR family transcriptional regulator [Christensenellaceae bacterium OttesenSCG-928-K19]|nr:TetR/AcrR family transcriptional regulator [Christensenellaceae bacterium OttesenSCG-928-K19]